MSDWSKAPTSEEGKKILAEVSKLAEPPKQHNALDNCKRVWEAFALGEAYERLWAMEHDAGENCFFRGGRGCQNLRLDVPWKED